MTLIIQHVKYKKDRFIPQARWSVL